MSGKIRDAIATQDPRGWVLLVVALLLALDFAGGGAADATTRAAWASVALPGGGLPLLLVAVALIGGHLSRKER